MDSGLSCLLVPVLMVAGTLVGLALVTMGQKQKELASRLAALTEALRNERDQRLELTAETARHRGEIAAVALRGEALRGGALVTSAMPAAATDAEVEAAIRAALEPSSAPALPGLKPVPRGVPRDPARPVTAPVVTVRKAPLDDLDEHDIKNALGDTVRPPSAAGGPAASPVSRPVPGPGGAPPPTRPPGAPSAAPAPDLSSPAKPTEMPSIETLAVWFAASFGGLILVVVALLVLREAVAAGFFGPSMRLAAAMFAALAAWALSGVLRWRKFDIPANALAGSGTAIAFGAIYAAHALYGYVPQPVAMASMVATTAVSMFAAVRKRSGLWALLSTVGGYATPLLLSTGENQAVGFFAYLFLVNAGVLWASRSRGWWWLAAVAAVVTTAFHVGWGITFRAPDQVPVALGACFVLAAWFFGAARGGASGPMRGTAFAGGLLLLCAGLPFLFPADPLQYDPLSSQPLTWTLGYSAELGAAWILAVTAMLAVFTSGERDATGSVTRLAATLFLAFALGTFANGWLFAAEPRAELVVGTLVATVAASTAFGRWRGPELALGPVFTGAMMTAISNAATPLDPAWMLGLSLAVSAGALAAALSIDVLAPFLAALAILPLLVNVTERLTPFLPDGGYVLLAMVVAFQAFAVVLAFRLRADRPGAVAAVVLAGPLAFFGFHLAWQAGLGAGEGVLALVLGVHVALAARMARSCGIAADSGQFAAILITLLTFAALAVPLQLEEAWLTVGWAIEVVLLAWLSRTYTHPAIKVFLGLLAVVVFIRLTPSPYTLAYGDGRGMILLNWTLYTWGLPATAFLVAAWLLPGPDIGKRALRVAATLLFFVCLNLEVAHAFAHDGELSFTSENLLESMTRSISWVLFGVVVLVVGMFRDSRSARFFGFGFVLLGGAKICLVDVIQLSGWIRIGSLFAFAVGLLLTSILFMRVVLRDRKKAEAVDAATARKTP